MNETGISSIADEIKSAHIEDDLTSMSGPDDAPEFDDYITNAHGEKFDPNIHKADDDGNPITTKAGKFRLKPGRKSGSSGHAQSRINSPYADRESYSEKPEISPAAQTAAAMYIHSGVMLFGHEWLPDPAIKEQEALAKAFHDYLETKNIEDIPPSLALFIACFGYAAPRLQKPQTQSRLETLILWVKIKLGRIKLNASRNDIRSNRMRENDTSEANGEKRGKWWRVGSGS